MDIRMDSFDSIGLWELNASRWPNDFLPLPYQRHPAVRKSTPRRSEAEQKLIQTKPKRADLVAFLSA